MLSDEALEPQTFLVRYSFHRFTFLLGLEKSTNREMQRGLLNIQSIEKFPKEVNKEEN